MEGNQKTQGGNVVETRKLKLVRVTTVSQSLADFLVGQLKFLNQYFEVVGVTSEDGKIQLVRDREGIRVENVHIEREIRLWSDIKSLWTLYRLFCKERPEIVHANTPKGSLLAMLAAKAAHVPHRIYLVTGLRYQGESGLFRTLLKIMEKITCWAANKVIPEGVGVKKMLMDDRITKKPLEVVHHGNINGKDTSYYSVEETRKKYGGREDFRASIGVKPDDFAFVFVGRIIGDKGMNELAEAMKALESKYPQIKLVLVGPYEKDLDPINPESEAFFENSEAVVLTGNQEDVRPYLMAADALVFPSYREGFPNVVLEAGCLGLPSIVTDINGCNEAIIEGENGIIIPPKDAGRLQKAMEKFLMNPALVAQMAGKARQLIVSRYKQEDVWAALLEMYRHELGG